MYGDGQIRDNQLHGLNAQFRGIEEELLTAAYLGAISSRCSDSTQEYRLLICGLYAMTTIGDDHIHEVILASASVVGVDTELLMLRREFENSRHDKSRRDSSAVKFVSRAAQFQCDAVGLCGSSSKGCAYSTSTPRVALGWRKQIIPASPFLGVLSIS
jgi:hypothetical protein